MKREVTIRQGMDLSALHRAVIALEGLQRVNTGSPCYHTYLTMLEICQEDGILLSDIGISDEDLLRYCRTGSKNALKTYAQLLMAIKNAGLQNTSTAKESVVQEIGQGHVTFQDMEELDLIEFTGHLPNTKKRRT